MREMEYRTSLCITYCYSCNTSNKRSEGYMLRSRPPLTSSCTPSSSSKTLIISPHIHSNRRNTSISISHLHSDGRKIKRTHPDLRRFLLESIVGNEKMRSGVSRQSEWFSSSEDWGSCCTWIRLKNRREGSGRQDRILNWPAYDPW